MIWPQKKSDIHVHYPAQATAHTTGRDSKSSPRTQYSTPQSSRIDTPSLSYTSLLPSNTRILQLTSESMSDTVFDTDTPPIRPRYVSLKYTRINDLKQLRYSKDTLPVRLGYFSCPLSPVKRQPATLVPRCPPSFPSERLFLPPVLTTGGGCVANGCSPRSQGQRRRRLAGDKLLLLLTNVPSHAAAMYVHFSSPFLLPSQAHLLFFLL
jgi:hypothetical protein